ncbi:MAG: hypothetical protein PV345_04450 [Wolbachia sp.]|nr:hypothetical protein [Wolbachia sp.]
MSNASFPYIETEYEEGEYNSNYLYGDEDEEETNKFYMSFNYNRVSPSIGSFSARVGSSSTTTQKVFSLNSNKELQEGYNPECNGEFLGSVPHWL